MKVLEFAMQMELDGKKYYQEQAKLNKDNELAKIFTILAAEEQKHADILKNIINNEDCSMEDSLIIEDTRNIFTGLLDKAKERQSMLDQIDIYRHALELEQKSIDLYKEMSQDAGKEKNKKIFEYLVKEEEKHFLLFDNLIIMLQRPEEWVEDAEFGVREDY